MIESSNDSFADVLSLQMAYARRGKELSVEDAVEFFPDLESEIKSKLPSAVLLDQALNVRSSDTITKVPSTISGCVVMEELGRGAMGVVYRAHQAAFNRDVAIKVIPKNPNDNSLLWIQNEARAMARLNHPNIVSAYGFEEDRNNAYLIMEYIDGWSLERTLTSAKPQYIELQARLRSDPYFLANLALTLTNAISHAHENQIIHRDIKPSNILVNSKGEFLLTDFGLAKQCDNYSKISKTGKAIGTPRYMSPEQFLGKYDERSDIYSLGLTLFELATGKLSLIDPAKGDSDQVDKILESECSGLPSCLRKIISKACHYSPDNRYSSTQELAHVLSRFCQGKQADRRNGKRKPDTEFKRDYRNKLIIGICLSAFFSTSLVMGYYSFFYKPPVEKSPFALSESDEGGSPNTDELTTTAKESTSESGRELGPLNKSELEALVDELHQFSDDIQEPDDFDKLVKVIDILKETPFRFIYSVRPYQEFIQASKLPSSEKLHGQMVIKDFARKVANGQIEIAQAMPILHALCGGNKLTPEMAKPITTKEIRDWLTTIEKTSSQATDRPAKSNSIEEKLRKVFE